MNVRGAATLMMIAPKDLDAMRVKSVILLRAVILQKVWSARMSVMVSVFQQMENASRIGIVRRDSSASF